MQDTGPAPGGGILVSIVQLGAATSCGLSRTANSIEELTFLCFCLVLLSKGLFDRHQNRRITISRHRAKTKLGKNVVLDFEKYCIRDHYSGLLVNIK